MMTALIVPERPIANARHPFPVSPPRRVTESFRLSEPAFFFSLLHEIEDRIASESLSIFAARQWQGDFGLEEWQKAERRLLHDLPVQQYIEERSILFQFDIRGYAVRDIALHIEGDLLCLCALQADYQGQERMSSIKLKLPRATHRDQVEVWKEKASLFIRVPTAVMGGHPQTVESIRSTDRIYSDRTAA